jgi:hypothetical protein
MPYEFGATSFNNFIWLASGQPFKQIATMDIEMNIGGAYSVEVIRMNGTLAGKAQRLNPHGGWASFDFKSGSEFWPGISDGAYKIRLVNRAPGTRKIKSGQLYFESDPG